jgi:UDP-N-acetylglucosamine 2-epimerase (non-hydrolysing)
MRNTLPTVLHPVGAQDDLVRMAPVLAALEGRHAFRQMVVHTGRDDADWLSDQDSAALGFPVPDLTLGADFEHRGRQTAAVLAAFERVVIEEQPQLVVVSGDLDSSLACALAATKLGVPVAHVESGLRNWDWRCPEEINRVVTDHLADTLFTQSPEARANLVGEGIVPGRIHDVGNTIVDSLRRMNRASSERQAWEALGLAEREYILLALGASTGLDDAELGRLVDAVTAAACRWPVVMALDPGLRRRLVASGTVDRIGGAQVSVPLALGCLDVFSLLKGAGAVVTDSGPVQDVASTVGVRCFTLNWTTERPVTLTVGTNVLVGDDPSVLASIEPSPWPPTPCAVPLWDGRAGERVADVLIANYALVGGARGHG